MPPARCAKKTGRGLGLAVARPDERFDAVEAGVVVLAVAHGGGQALNAGVDFVDAAAHVRVGGEVFRDVDARRPLLAPDFLEGPLQALRPVARRREVLQPYLIRLGFVHAAVVEHGGLSRGHAPGHHCAGALPAAEQGGRERAHDARSGHGLRPFHAAGDVALRHVGQFVGQHARKLGFVLKLHDEPGVHENVAARGRQRRSCCCAAARWR